MKYIKKYNQKFLESNQINVVPSETKWEPPQPITSRDTFETGKSEILKDSQEFKKISEQIKKCPKGTTVTVTGGASAVGSPKFNNQALAQKRAQNMIDALKEINPDLRYQEGPHKVGTSTVKDSTQAKQEQYIMVEFTKSGGESKSTSGIDNTGVDQSGVKKPNQEDLTLGRNERNLRIIFPEGMPQEDCEAHTKKIINFLGTLNPTGLSSEKRYLYAKGNLKAYVPTKK